MANRVYLRLSKLGIKLSNLLDEVSKLGLKLSNVLDEVSKLGLKLSISNSQRLVN